MGTDEFLVPWPSHQGLGRPQSLSALTGTVFIPSFLGNRDVKEAVILFPGVSPTLSSSGPDPKREPGVPKTNAAQVLSSLRAWPKASVRVLAAQPTLISEFVNGCVSRVTPSQGAQGDGRTSSLSFYYVCNILHPSTQLFSWLLAPSPKPPTPLADLDSSFRDRAEASKADLVALLATKPTGSSPSSVPILPALLLLHLRADTAACAVGPTALLPSRGIHVSTPPSLLDDEGPREQTACCYVSHLNPLLTS